MAISCGHCKDYHPDVLGVRRCAESHGVMPGEPNPPVRIKSKSDPLESYVKPAPKQDVPITPGAYRGKADSKKRYKVYKARAGTHMLAAEIILPDPDDEDARPEFVYAGAASRYVRADTRLSKDEAASFGQTWGVCCNCGKLLTVPQSIERGMGPKCWGSYEGAA